MNETELKTYLGIAAEPRPLHPARMENLHRANQDRHATASVTSAPTVQAAVATLRQRGVPLTHAQRLVAELRTQYHDATLTELGALVGCSRHIVAGHLRRIVLKAQEGAPHTS